uniref:Uncharacterized protein n=1 Tax=Setaria viridis TaxID=4556 RepID=A0A4U6VR35_SETVI|nr:hypothetical protein SEVIR_2G078440v2 [Setaria viridis]
MLPLFADQGLTARLMAERRVGLEVPRDDRDGSVRREDVAAAVRRVMVEDEGEVFAGNARELREILWDTARQEEYIEGSFGNSEPRGDPAIFPGSEAHAGILPRAESPPHLGAHRTGRPDHIREFSPGRAVLTSRLLAAQPPPRRASRRPPPLRVRIPIPTCARPPPLPLCSPVPLTTASRRRPPCRWRPASGVRAAPLFLHLPVVASPVRLVVASPSSPHPHAGSIFAGDLLRDCPHLR